jgi:NTP pyrophosphatase (non-canonical NTP hydrolase)
MTQSNIYEEAIKKFGVPAQVDMLIEEMAELTQALLKWRRCKENALDNVCEELVDVEIVLAQIKTGLDINLIGEFRTAKLTRLRELLNKKS